MSLALREGYIGANSYVTSFESINLYYYFRVYGVLYDFEIVDYLHDTGRKDILRCDFVCDVTCGRSFFDVYVIAQADLDTNP